MVDGINGVSAVIFPQIADVKHDDLRAGLPSGGGFHPFCPPCIVQPLVVQIRAAVGVGIDVVMQKDLFYAGMRRDALRRNAAHGEGQVMFFRRPCPDQVLPAPHLLPFGGAEPQDIVADALEERRQIVFVIFRYDQNGAADQIVCFHEAASGKGIRA